jgi:hypothetical protein
MSARTRSSCRLPADPASTGPVRTGPSVGAPGVARYLDSMDRSHYPTRKTRLKSQGEDPSVLGLSAGNRMAMVWTLTLQARAFAEDLRDEPRLRRDVGRVIRGQR